MKNLKVKDIMSKSIVTIDKDATMHDAIEKMLENEVHGLVVMDVGKPIGIVTINDTLILIEKGESGTDMIISEFMSKSVISIEPDDDLQKALGMMVENEVHRLPVIKDKKLMGIITSNDLMRVYLRLNKK